MRPSACALHTLSLPEGRPRSISLATSIAAGGGVAPGLGLGVIAVGLALIPAGGGAVLPELDVAVLAEGAALDELTLLAHEVLDGQAVVAKDVEVVADDVTVAARGAGDENGAVVVALLGDIVGGARAAGQAGEGQLVGRLLGGVCGGVCGPWAGHGVGVACCRWYSRCGKRQWQCCSTGGREEERLQSISWERRWSSCPTSQCSEA